MSSRLSIFCDKLLEAGWLVALIVAPLFFNVYSSRVFEPDKISLVRSIALAMVVAWLIKRIDAGLPQGSLVDAARASLRDNPLILPTFAIVIVYLIATLLSVAPNVSLWGSYQRLQGTYSTFSYIVIFLIAASGLRTRAQFDRAVGVIIAASLPVSFYGILQHFKLDPLPWGGDTTERVASNMGNSIFVAAYLIMVVPVTLARWVESFVRVTRDAARRGLVIGAIVLAPIVLFGSWLWDFALGTGLALLFWMTALVVGIARPARLRDALFTATFTIVLVAQLTAIFFSQSRGPLLGLGAGLFAFAVLGALMVMHRLPRAWRTVTLGGVIAVAIVAMLFLVVFNLPASPLESLKSVPYVGRLGQILDPTSPTARVRELIWQGALKLFLPHAPLWSPTNGDDPFNLIRPLVGYGPEAMYVAFNPFYPPELGQLEARNASPDRSHNETFDALVMNGLLGFAANMFLFVSIFYFGLKWLGLVTSTRERNLFIALWLVVGFAFALIFGAWRGWHWVGVALPAGMILGFLIFLVIDASRRYRTGEIVPDVRRALWLAALLAAFIAHFVEIHFGIAIAATRTHFWFYAALLVVLGLNHLTDPPPVAAPAPRTVPEESPRVPATRRRQRRRVAEHQRVARQETEISPAPVIAWTVIATLMLVTLAFEFITNQEGVPNPFDVIRISLFVKGGQPSYGIFTLFILTWLTTGIIGLTERATRATWLYDVLLFVILSFTALLWFMLLQTRWITTPGDLTEAFISLQGLYYTTLFICLIAYAVAMWLDMAPRPTRMFRSAFSALSAPLLAGAGIGLIVLTNFNGIQADILYKAGTNYDAAGTWDRSVIAHGRAFDLQPAQDFYALFLGRAYLETSRTADPGQRAELLTRAEETLLTAQQLNPLNTDHTANLARLHRIVATMTENPVERANYFQKSSEYYAMATRLSPNTAYLRNEWSQTYLQSGNLEQARLQLETSSAIDPKFAQTYVYLGDYYRLQGDVARAVENYLKAIQIEPATLADPEGRLQAGAASVLALPEFAPRAIEAYRAQVQKHPDRVQSHLALAELYRQTNQLDLARQELEQVVRLASNDLMANLNLVNFYSENGQIDAAVTAMSRVMALVPRNRPDYARFQDFYGQLQTLQRAIQAVQKSPNDVTARRTLASIWKMRGQPAFVLKEYEALARLAPNDYDAHKNLALLYAQTNRLDDAQRALNSAVALAGENEKPLWQNVQAAINAHKANRFDEALRAAQAALALAIEADKPALQGYATLLQEKVVGK